METSFPNCMGEPDCLFGFSRTECIAGQGGRRDLQCLPAPLCRSAQFKGLCLASFGFCRDELVRPARIPGINFREMRDGNGLCIEPPGFIVSPGQQPVFKPLVFSRHYVLSHRTRHEFRLPTIAVFPGPAGASFQAAAIRRPAASLPAWNRGIAP